MLPNCVNVLEKYHIDSNTKTVHFPKCDMCLKCEFYSKQWNVQKWNKASSKNLSLSINKDLMLKLLASNWSLDYSK